MTTQRLAPRYYRSLAYAVPMLCVVLLIASCVWTNTVSVGMSGAPGTGNSLNPAISGDGRYVAFDSWASNLVPGDTAASQDIFLRDNSLGTTRLISVSSTGVAANGHSLAPSISDDGRYIVYGSAASNLVAGDSNNAHDIFLYDRDTATTTRISVDSNGIEGNGFSYFALISADGRYIAFSSDASNLVPGDNNGVGDIFVHDRATAKTTRVSVNDQGDEADAFSLLASLSDDGRYIVFSSRADNLVADGSPFQRDIFVHDQTLGITTLVSVDSTGDMGFEVSELAAISGDGRFVSFSSRKQFLMPWGIVYYNDVFVHDRNTSTTSMITVPGLEHTNGHLPALSVDGRYVVFHSPSGLAAGDTNNAEDVYVHDRNTGTTERVSLTASGAQSGRRSQNALFSTDGRYVAYQTWPIPTDPHGLEKADVVVRAFPALTVTSIVPSSLQIGTTTAVTITGTHFRPGAVPRVEGGQVSDPVIVNETTMTATVTVPADTAPGSGDVMVDLAGTGPGLFTGTAARCTDCATFPPPGGC